MTVVVQPWDNSSHGRYAGTARQRTLEDGCLGPPGGVRRAGRRPCGPHRDVVGTHGVASGRRGIHLARGGSRDVGGVHLVPARASRTATWALDHEAHAHPRHGPRPVVGPAVLRAPPAAAASAVQRSPVLSTQRARRCARWSRHETQPVSIDWSGRRPENSGNILRMISDRVS